MDKAAKWVRGLVGGSKTGRPPVEFNREEAERLHAEGLSIRKIAERLGVSKSSVATYLSEPKAEPSIGLPETVASGAQQVSRQSEA